MILQIIFVLTDFENLNLNQIVSAKVAGKFTRDATSNKTKALIKSAVT